MRDRLARVVRWLRTRWGWDERHAELAAQPLLRGVSRTVIRRLATDGDEVTFEGGQQLLAEDHIGYWFFLIVDGSLTVTRGGVVTTRLSAGGHCGEVAILGFRPQPATITTGSPVRAWVFGRRQFLALAYSERLVQQRLFPGAEGEAFPAKVRELREIGSAEWRALSERPEWREALLASPLREVRPGRIVSRPPPSLIPWAGGRSRVSSPAPPLTVSLGWRGRAVIASVVTVAVTMAALLYHPAIVVVDSAPAVDVAGDVTVTGVPTYPIHGRYLLLAVRFARPNAVNAALAVLRHRSRASLAPGQPGETRADASRQALAAFRQSESDAVTAAAVAAHVDPAAVHATFKRRDIGGPSAGLIYALVVYDLLTPADVAGGRTIAATGSIDAAGDVGIIGFVSEKLRAANRVHADVLLVPEGQLGDSGGARPVTSLKDAVRSLAA